MPEKKKSVAGILTLLVLCCVLGGCKAGIPVAGTDITRVTVILPHFDDGYWMLIEETEEELRDGYQNTQASAELQYSSDGGAFEAADCG